MSTHTRLLLKTLIKISLKYYASEDQFVDGRSYKPVNTIIRAEMMNKDT